MLEVSSPGKIHIIGEHAVVYGYPAIISAIDKRTRVKAEKSEKIKIKNNLYQKETEFEIEETAAAAKESRELWKKGDKKNDFTDLFAFLKSDFWKRNKATIGLIFERLKINPVRKSLSNGVKGGVSLIIDGDLPPGVGLGSSASLSVAITKAIAELYAPQISNQKINEIAFELEKLNHGRPSGGDNSSSTFGGTIWFEKGKIKPLSLPDFLKNLIIVLTKRKLSTGDLVQKVGNLEKSFRDSKIKNIAEATYKMRRALENEASRASARELRLQGFSPACAGSEIPHRRPPGIHGKSRGLLVRDKNLDEIKYLINFAQDNLAELGISNPEIDGLVKEVRKIGGAAKLSGGGGGTVICFHQDKKRLIKLLNELKVHSVEIKLGAEGVRVEGQL